MEKRFGLPWIPIRVLLLTGAGVLALMAVLVITIGWVVPGALLTGALTTAGAAFAIAWARAGDNDEALASNDGGEGHDRLLRAVRALEDPSRQIRITAIHDLAQLGSQSSPTRALVCDLLLEYLRHPDGSSRAPEQPTVEEPGAGKSSRDAPDTTTDVQAALDALLTLARATPPVLSDLVLRQASIRGRDLAGVSLARTDLARGDLRGSRLRGADMSRMDLSYANLEGADLSSANLSGANLQGAILRDAQLANALLVEANLQHAILNGADLRDARLAGAVYDDTTRWPAGLNPAMGGAVQVK